MYDYSSMPTFHIENVDHEIHILGVKLSAMFWGVGIFILTVRFVGPMAVFLSLIYCGVARYFFLADERGRPIEYSSSFLANSKKIPYLSKLFDLDRIIHSEGEYRE